MFSRLFRAAALVIAGSLGAVSAQASTVDIVGGLTTIDVTLDLGPIVASPGGVASASGSLFSFPITGGSVDSGGNAVIEHDGSLATLSFGSAYVTVGNFVIDTAAANVSGVANGTGIATGTSAVELFTFGTPGSGGIPLLISPTLNTALNATFGSAAVEAVFGVKDVTGAKFGLANTSPEVVPLPAAGWMLLAGLGGLAAIRRRQRAQA